MKKNFIKGLILVLLTVFVSCNDDDDPTPYGYGDVYVASRLETGPGEGAEPTVVYGLHIDAGGIYGTLSSVVVTNGATNYTLEKDDDTGAFYFDSEEFSTELPATGTYTFSYVFESGEVSSFSDVVTDDVLLPAEITSSTFSDNKIELEWNEIEDAEAIEIRLRESDGDLVFSSKTSSGFLAGDETDYTISGSVGSWLDGYTMINGDTYTIEIIGLLGDNTSYLQAISTATTTIVWGE